MDTANTALYDASVDIVKRSVIVVNALSRNNANERPIRNAKQQCKYIGCYFHGKAGSSTAS
jgi:hypothetical protein